MTRGTLGLLRMRARGILTLTLVSIPVVAQLASAQAVRSSGRAQCTPSAFAKLMGLDEKTLRHHETREVGGEAAEGSTLTVLRDDSAVRIVRLLDLGETGRSQKTAFVLDSHHYLVWVVEQRYERAIEGRRRPVASSSANSVFLVCDGVPQAGAGDDAEDITARIRGALGVGREKE